MSTTSSIINTTVTTAAPAGAVIATITVFGVPVGILNLIAMAVATLMSVATRIYANMNTKDHMPWQKNLLLGTITTTLSIGVVSEYELSWLWAAAAGIGISFAGEAIISALGQGAIDLLKDAIQAAKDRIKKIGSGPKTTPEDASKTPAEPLSEPSEPVSTPSTPAA